VPVDEYFFLHMAKIYLHTHRHTHRHTYTLTHTHTHINTHTLYISIHTHLHKLMHACFSAPTRASIQAYSQKNGTCASPPPPLLLLLLLDCAAGCAVQDKHNPSALLTLPPSTRYPSLLAPPNTHRIQDDLRAENRVLLKAINGLLGSYELPPIPVVGGGELEDEDDAPGHEGD
jgi:hypothetical protein